MSIARVIESIEREISNNATKEDNSEMVDITNLEDNTDKERRYIKGRSDNCETEV